jgi:predicted enzyme related to lactoylglutathione lyase
MTEASSMPGAGIPCWMDLLTSDAGRARDFYKRIFGWQALEPSPEFGGYFMFTLNGAPVAGGMPIIPEMADMDMTPGWGIYLASTDVKAAIERAVAHGGKVRVPAMDVAHLGTQAILEDSGSGRIGIWQPGTFAGFGAVGTGKPGTPAWFELHTRDHAGAVAFYRAALGWDPKVVSDTDEFRLTAVQAAGQPVAGIMDACAYLPEGQAPHWDAYVSVADADKTLALAADLGGTVAQQPMDTPFGRLAALADPMGARIKVVARTGQ